MTISLLLSLAALGCHESDCDDDCKDAGDDPGADEASPTDLPCAEVDLATDDRNCGSCGHECVVDFPETPYAAGGCEAGQCGTRWSACAPQLAGETCTKVCAAAEMTCDPAGCGGKTGMVFAHNPDQGCLTPVEPYEIMSGSCDDPIPWLEDPVGVLQSVMCCCA